jgi:hypothetical protein
LGQGEWALVHHFKERLNAFRQLQQVLQLCGLVLAGRAQEQGQHVCLDSCLLCCQAP